MSLDDDTGNVTITAAGVIGALCALLLVVGVAARGTIHAHRAQIAAELAAVAAAHAVFRAQDPCQAARDTASRNNAQVTGCELINGDAAVTVKFGTKEVTAKAGPLG